MQTLKEIEQLSVKLNDAYNSSGIINALEEFLPSVNIFMILHQKLLEIFQRVGFLLMNF